MTVRWGDPQPALLEQSGVRGTVLLVLTLLVLMATMAGTL